MNLQTAVEQAYGQDLRIVFRRSDCGDWMRGLNLLDGAGQICDRPETHVARLEVPC